MCVVVGNKTLLELTRDAADSPDSCDHRQIQYYSYVLTKSLFYSSRRQGEISLRQASLGNDTCQRRLRFVLDDTDHHITFAHGIG